MTRAPDTLEPAATWAADALCREVGPELFFPPPESVTGDYNAARRICDACPVQQPCLDEAMEQEGDADKGDRFGMRGGLTANQRYTLHRSGARAAA